MHPSQFPKSRLAQQGKNSRDPAALSRIAGRTLSDFFTRAFQTVFAILFNTLSVLSNRDDGLELASPPFPRHGDLGMEPWLPSGGAGSAHRCRMQAPRSSARRP